MSATPPAAAESAPARNAGREAGPARLADWSERAAILASAACLVHCLALPLVIAALPALATVLAIPESFHVWVLAFAVPAAGFALGQGWRRHRALVPIAAGAVGLVLLAYGALAVGETPWETPVTVAGSLMLAGAHIANWRLRHARPHCC